MLQPNRHKDSKSYRYGFNEMEFDNEIKGEGNSYSTFWRQYDPRLGRWLSMDPAMKKYASWSPYATSFNNPIHFKDTKGDDPITAILEGVMAFAIEAGLDFLAAYILEDKNVDQSFDAINWWGAGWEATKTTGLAAITPTGTATARKVYKISKSKIGKITAKIAFSMVEEAGKKYKAGDYDTDGSFDMDKLVMRDLFYVALIDVLVSEGYSKRAKKIAEKLDKANLNVLKQNKKLWKLLNGNASDTVKEKAGKNRTKKLQDAHDKVFNLTIQEQAEKGATETIKKVSEHGAEKADDNYIEPILNDDDN